MSGRYLVDTNIAVALLNGDAAITARFEVLPEVFLSIVTLGELYFGAANSGRPAVNLARVSGFAADCSLLISDSETARRYGDLRSELRKKGRPIPENDIWTAACALQHRLILATRDRHFEYVRDLQSDRW